jgi:hypothetical protein
LAAAASSLDYLCVPLALLPSVLPAGARCKQPAAQDLFLELVFDALAATLEEPS